MSRLIYFGQGASYFKALAVSLLDSNLSYFFMAKFLTHEFNIAPQFEIYV